MMICFYHKGDLDGHCSGAIVRHKYPKARMIGIDYEDEFPWNEVKVGDDVIMCDFSLPMDQMDRLRRTCVQVLEGTICDLKANGFIWIDHHKTAIDKALEAGFETPGLRVVGKAACELTWEYFFPAPAPLAVWLLGRYDVFDLDAHPDVLPFQYGMRGEVTDPAVYDPVWKDLFAGNSGITAAITKAGRRILDYQRGQDAKLMARHAFFTVLDDWVALAVNNGPGGSMKFEAWSPLGNYPSYALLISFARLPKKKWLVNLYTYRDDVDCGEIAKRHGGGGHRKAAGFICDELPFEI